jgi:hypothetical protein
MCKHLRLIKLIFTIFGLNNNIMHNSHTKSIINPSITPDTLAELKSTVIKILEDNAENI